MSTELILGLATGLLFGKSLPDAVGAARAAGADCLRPSWRCLTPELIASAHSSGLAVSTWTVNEAGRAASLAVMGVDSIATNFPDRIIDALRGPAGAGGSDEE